MKLRVVTVAGDAEGEARLAAELSAREDVELVLRCMDRVELLGAVWGGNLDGIVCVGAPSWVDSQCAMEAGRRGIRLVGVVGDTREAEWLGTLGAGLVPAHASCEEILDRCRAEWTPAEPPASSQPSSPTGSLVAVWGPKGSPGRTTVAVELAWELARGEPATLLIDADPYGGDILQLLGVVEELPTIVWASRMAAKDELDAARLSLDIRRAGKDGPVFIPGLPRAELWAEISGFGWNQLLTVARACFRFTVCDVGFCLEPEASPYPEAEGRNRITRSTVAEADHVIAVCRTDPLGVKNFLWAIDELRQLTDVDEVLIVANRTPPAQHAEVGEILRKHLGKRPIAYIPDAPDSMARATMSGIPLASLEAGSDVSTGIRALAAALGGKVRSRGFLSRLAGSR